jgi:hypothetical protein
MAEKVQIELTLEQAQAVRGWLENNRAIVQNEASLKALEDASKQASDTSKRGFDAANGMLANFGRTALATVTSVLSIRTAMQLLGKEIEANNRKNAAALDQQLDLATHQRRAFDALAPNSDLTPQALTSLVESQTQIPLAQQYPAIVAALKEAGSGFSQRQAAETALFAGGLAPHLQGQELADLAAGAVDLQKQRPGLGKEQSVAQLLRLSRYSESSVAELSKELVPALGRGQSFGGAKAGTLEGFYLALQDKMDVGVGEAVATGEKFLRDLSVKGDKAGLFQAYA